MATLAGDWFFMDRSLVSIWTPRYRKDGCEKSQPPAVRVMVAVIFLLVTKIVWVSWSASCSPLSKTTFGSSEQLG